MSIGFHYTPVASTWILFVHRGGPGAGFGIVKKQLCAKKWKTWIRTKKIKKPYSTRDSLVVPYQSTDLAQRCLTSQFGWDAVLSPWYDRMTMALPGVEPPPENPAGRKKSKHWIIWVSIPVPRPCEGRALPIAPITHARCGCCQQKKKKNEFEKNKLSVWENKLWTWKKKLWTWTKLWIS